MTQQYLRNCSLVVADPSGNGIELGALRVTFEVRRGDTQTPNTADIKVWNLSANTSNQLRGVGGVPEFQYLCLKVSYGSQPLTQIFAGSIKQLRQGRENQKDSYIAITAAAGDGVYNFAPAAFTMAAGRTAQGTVQNLLAVGASAVEAMNTKPIFSSDQQLIEGYIPAPALDPNRQIRGRVFFGAWKDEMRDFAKSQDCKWWIDDNGGLTVVPLTSYIPGGTVIVTPSTGLIGVPEQTQNGLSVRVLMNPSIRIGQTIKLDSTDINELRLGVDTKSFAENSNLRQGAAKLNANGIYYVMKAEHFGDTRGNAWYTDLTCLSVDATVPPPSATAQSTVAPDVILQY